MALGRTRKQAEPLNEQGLYDYAVKALGRRMRTQAELARLMAARVEPGERGAEMVAAVVQRLREYGYLDDAGYAETYARLRQENEKFGARRVRQDLARKGIAAPLAEETIAARYEGTDELALARAHLERKRIAQPKDAKEAARVARRLVAAGFSTSTVGRLLRQWDAPEETLAALETMDEDSSDSDGAA